MAASWLTIAAPYIPEILRLARPLFTHTPPPQADAGQRMRVDLMSDQIDELQEAATQNAESIRLLASDMQKTIELLQANSERMEKRLIAAQRLALVAGTAAALAFCLAAVALALR